jgi:hypothetical protein
MTSAPPPNRVSYSQPDVTVPSSMTVSPLLPFIRRLGVAVQVNRTLQPRRYPIHAPGVRARPEVHSRESHLIKMRLASTTPVRICQKSDGRRGLFILKGAIAWVIRQLEDWTMRPAVRQVGFVE